MLMQVGLQRANSRNQDSGTLVRMCMDVFLNDYTNQTNCRHEHSVPQGRWRKRVLSLPGSLTMQKALSKVLSLNN